MDFKLYIHMCEEARICWGLQEIVSSEAFCLVPKEAPDEKLKMAKSWIWVRQLPPQTGRVG